MIHGRKMLLTFRMVCTRAALLCAAAAALSSPLLNAEPAVYTVQLMATVDQQTARDYAALMLGQGIEAFVEQVPDNATAAAWKVRTGRFPARSDADTYASVLQGRGIACWVTTTGPAPAAPPQEPRQSAVSLAAAPTDTRTLPQSPVVRTYKYFNPDDQALHVTASLATIPEKLRGQIREIAVYPVAFIGLDTNDLTVTVAVEHDKKKVRLAELAASDRPVPDACVQSFAAAMSSQPLRLKYDPDRTAPDGTLSGMVYLGTGDSLALAMVRRGIAAHNPDAVSMLEQQLFREAEDGARREKACIWERQ